MNSCYNIIGSTKILNNNLMAGITATVLTGLSSPGGGVNIGYLNNTNFPGYMCIDNTGQYIYINSSDASNSSNAKPIYSTNGGASFAYSTFSPALPNPNTPNQNVLASSNGQYILYTAGSTYLPYKSYDYGATFTQYTTSNFPTINTTPICYNCGISDNGQVIAITITGGSHHGLYVCTNGSSTITSDVFTAYMTTFSNIQGCSMSTNGTYLLLNNLNSTGFVQYVFNTSTLTYTDPGSNPVNTGGYQSPYGQISDDGQRIWTIGSAGGTGHQTLQSNYYDAGASSPSWNLSYGENSWLGGFGPSIGYCVGQVNYNTCSASSYMSMMLTVMSQSSSVTSPYPQDMYNVVISTNNGVSWFKLGAITNTAGGVVDFTTIKINKSVCSKNGQWLLLNGYNNGYAYIVQFPTTNI